MPVFPTPADHSLDDIAPDSELRKLYPRDLYPNPQSVRLPLGKTTYWLLGPEDGVKIALIHGISTPSLIWKNVAPYLAEHGFRVLAYDLFGRGYSEAPDTVYNADLYTTQLALLLQHIQWPSAHIIGLSMGGGIAGAFAATFPNLVTERVVLLASAGAIEAAKKSPNQLPAKDSEISSKPNNNNLMPSIRELQSAILPGYTRALASSFHEGPIRGMENAFKAIGKTPRLKCLIIHGTNDNTVDIKAGERIKDYIPTAQWCPIEGADHDFIINDNYYDQVRTAILKFLRE